jgi:hypothetical protein
LANTKRWAFKSGGCQVIVSIVNGATVCADLYENSEIFLGLEVDLNGHKGPNTFGKDYQDFYFKKDGKVFDADWEERGETVCTNCGWGSSIGSVGQIMADGWKITYY